MQNKKSVKSQLVLASEMGALLPVCRVTNLLIKQFDDIFLYDIIEWWIWEVHSASKHISQGLLPLTRNRRKFILEISDFGFSTEWIHIFIQGVILHYYKPSIALQWSAIYKKSIPWVKVNYLCIMLLFIHVASENVYIMPKSIYNMGNFTCHMFQFIIANLCVTYGTLFDKYCVQSYIRCLLIYLYYIHFVM